MRPLLSFWVRPQVVPEDVGRQLSIASLAAAASSVSTSAGAPGVTPRTICYVVTLCGPADWAVIQQVCSTHGLPQPTRSVQPASPGQATCIFLERRAGLFGNRLDRRTPAALRGLVHRACGDPACDIDFVPVSVFWGRAPDREHSWMRLLFAETWHLAGRLRRAVAVLVNARNLLVQFGDPISLRATVAGAPNTARAVRRVTRTLRTALRNQRAATLGPDLSHRRTIVAQVLRTQAVRKVIAEEVKTRNQTRREALLQAKRYADEIAANYSHTFVMFMSRLLTWLWNRLYDGVKLHNLQNLQDVVEGHEIVYVPCHRSHMDYLLLSYIIYNRGGYAVPHIAAGLNLNMPLVGPLLRRGGAFFLRRSFGSNTLYTMVFMKYLGLMMARGHSLEYFIEGGRSRTGRLLQPKTGMLAMTVRSYLRGGVDEGRRPIVFVPVYFGYERLVEGKTYIGELSGAKKEKESVFTMLRTLPALRKRFGQVSVSIGEPIHLNALLDTHAPQWREESREIERPTWVNRAVDDLANRIMVNINAAACAMPINLLALALLATPKQAMLETDLAQQLELYTSLLRQAPYSPWVAISDMDGASMIGYGERMGLLARRPHALGDVLRMTEENAVLMTYFRNNVLHLMAMPSLIASCFLNNRSMRTEDIQRLAWRIYPYIADELFMRWNEGEIAGVVREILEDFANHGLVEAAEGGAEWRRPTTGTVQAVQLSMLAQISVPIIERYYLAIALLLRAGSGRISQDTLENQCYLTAQRMSLLYELNSPEFFDKSLFKNFLDLLRSRNVLGVNPEGKLTFTELLLAVSADAQWVLHEEIRNSVLQVTHR